jgi:serine/threonine protein kinase
VSEVWALPGYDVQALIGFGATGEVWRARELATGAAVAVKRLRDGADPEAVASLRREAAVLRSLDTPYVVRLRAVLGEGADTVLVLDLAGGGSLAALLARRGSLDPGEVVTIAAPLAQALAAAHARGLVHGDVTPSNVLFTADGMPLLADLGLARLAGQPRAGVDGTAEYVDPVVAAGGVPDTASDVWALAAVCHHLLSGTAPHDGVSADDVLAAARAGERAPLGLLAPSAPRPLVAAIELALQADPAARPDAATFAAALRRSHAAAPVRFVGGLAAAAPVPELRPTHAVHSGPRPAPLPADRGPGRRRALVVAGAVAGLALAAAVGWLSGRSGAADAAGAVAAPVPATSRPESSRPSRPGSSRPSRPESPGAAPVRPPDWRVPARAPDWRAVLGGLDLARARAFATGDAGGLLGVYAPGSALLPVDRAAIAQLEEAGWTARGVHHLVQRVSVVSSDRRTATLRVVDVLAPYTVVDGTGRVVRRADGRSAAAFSVTLVRTGAGWRLLRLVAA